MCTCDYRIVDALDLVVTLTGVGGSKAVAQALSHSRCSSVNELSTLPISFFFLSNWLLRVTQYAIRAKGCKFD
jgi:hypothetical protein